MSQFVVVGLGAFGMNLSQALARKGHDVIAMDIDEHKVRAIQSQVARALVADVDDLVALNDFVYDGVEAVIVDLGHTDSSIYTVAHLHQLGARRIIAKARDELQGRTLTSVGATDVVYPEKAVAEQYAERLHSPNLIEYVPLGPEHRIVDIPAPAGVVGRTLEDVRVRARYHLQVIALRHPEYAWVDLVPDPQEPIMADTGMVIAGKSADIDRFLHDVKCEARAR